MRIYALVGFSAVDEKDQSLPLELTQRRILEALVYEDGVARSAEEIRRRAQLADSNTVGQGLSRLRAAWSKSLGTVAREIFPEARASKGYRLQVARADVDVWRVEDLQRSVREALLAAKPDEDWDAITARLHEGESVWSDAEKRNREHPSALVEAASDLGKRVAQLSVRRFENRKRWTEIVLRNGKRADLVLPMLEVWLNDTESPSRSDIALWRLWIEAKADLAGTTNDDLDEVVENARAAGLDVAVLDAVRRTAATRLSTTHSTTPFSIEAITTIERRKTGNDQTTVAAQTAESTQVGDDSHPINLNATQTRPPIAGLELNIRSPFVGRLHEREQLVRSGVQSLRDRTGHLVTITGEPGVGKSRLVAEVVAMIDANLEADSVPATWYVGRCLPQGGGLTCWALGEIVKAMANVRPQDAPEIAIAKLEDCLANAHVDATEIPDLVRHLAPLVGGNGGAKTGDTERFFAWGRALGAIGAAHRVALIFEDLHWADDMLLEFLDSLTEQGSPSAMFVVATARPEFYEKVNGWAGGGRSATTLALSRLAADETETLLLNFRSRDEAALTKELRDEILERSGGNPLFAEELALMVNQSGGDATALQKLPRLVELVVAARLDHLSENAAAVAFAAANIGRVFWSGAIESVVDLSASDLRNALAELVRVDLVQRVWSSSMTGQLEYTFWHAIVRDVASSRLPTSEIPTVHLRTAAWLRETASSRIVDVAEQLANHYAIVLDHLTPDELSVDSLDHAIEAFRLAGQRVILLDRTRAGRYYEQALAITPPDHAQRAPLLADHAYCYSGIWSLDQCEQLCRGALAELEDREGDVAELARARVLATLALNVSWRGDLPGAIKLLDESVQGLIHGSHDEYMSRRSLTVFLLAAVGDRERTIEMLPDTWAWCKEAVGAGRSSDIAVAHIYACLMNPYEVASWFEEVMTNHNSILHSSIGVPGNLALVRSGISGPLVGLQVLEAAVERHASQSSDALVWVRCTQIHLLTQVGELSRAFDAVKLSEPAVRALSPMFLMELLGQKIFAQLLATGIVDTDALAEMDDLLTLLPGTHEMLLTALHASALAHFVDGRLNESRAALKGTLHIFECRIDRMSALHAITRLAMLRLALQLDEIEIAERIASTCDPLTPSQEAERLAISGYLAAARGDFIAGAATLGQAAEAFETLDFAIESLWIHLHRANMLASAGQSNASAVLKTSTLARLEAFGAFGLHAEVLDRRS